MALGFEYREIFDGEIFDGFKFNINSKCASYHERALRRTNRALSIVVTLSKDHFRTSLCQSLFKPRGFYFVDHFVGGTLSRPEETQFISASKVEFRRQKDPKFLIPAHPYITPAFGAPARILGISLQ